MIDSDACAFLACVRALFPCTEGFHCPWIYYKLLVIYCENVLLSDELNLDYLCVFPFYSFFVDEQGKLKFFFVLL